MVSSSPFFVRFVNFPWVNRWFAVRNTGKSLDIFFGPGSAQSHGEWDAGLGSHLIHKPWHKHPYENQAVFDEMSAKGFDRWWNLTLGPVEKGLTVCENERISPWKMMVGSDDFFCFLNGPFSGWIFVIFFWGTVAGFGGFADFWWDQKFDFLYVFNHTFGVLTCWAVQIWWFVFWGWVER